MHQSDEAQLQGTSMISGPRERRPACPLTWHDLPYTVRDAVTERCGTVKRDLLMPTSGLTPTVLTCLDTVDAGPVVLKAGSVDSEAGAAVRREVWARIHRTDLPGPQVVWAQEAPIDGWQVLLTKHVKGVQPNVTPEALELDWVLDLLTELGTRSTPGGVPDSAPRLGHDLERILGHARELVEEPHALPPEERALCEDALLGLDPRAVAGTRLLHGCLEPRNLRMHRSDVRILDWSGATYGAAGADLVPFGLHLVDARHTPAQVEELLSQFPAWTCVPDDTLTGLITAWTLHYHYQAVRAPRQRPSGSVGIASLPIKSAGIAWVRHRR